MIVVLVAVAGCGAQLGRPAPLEGRPAAHPGGQAREPRTADALLKIATVFNNDYDSGNYGPVGVRSGTEQS